MDIFCWLLGHEQIWRSLQRTDGRSEGQYYCPRCSMQSKPNYLDTTLPYTGALVGLGTGKFYVNNLYKRVIGIQIIRWKNRCSQKRLYKELRKTMPNYPMPIKHFIKRRNHIPTTKP